MNAIADTLNKDFREGTLIAAVFTTRLLKKPLAKILKSRQATVAVACLDILP